MLAHPRRALPEPTIRWTRGGSEQDTLFAYPRQAVADSHHVYVLDSGHDRIVALRAADGALAWRRGGASDSTTPPLTPTAIAVLPGGGIAVADIRHHAIALVRPNGTIAHRVALPDVATITSLCALSTTRFLASGAGPAGHLLELRDDPASTAPRPLPWRDAPTRPGITTQTWLAGSADLPRCAVGLVLGRGFALHDGTTYSTPHPYVEPFDLPAVTRSAHGDSASMVVVERLSNDRTAAKDLAFAGGPLAVAFAGETPLRARLVDYYDARTGAYLGTTVSPFRISALAAHGRDLYLLHQRQGRPAITALALPPSAASIR